MKSFKVVVTGPFNAGKTMFVRTASDIEIVTTERRMSDPTLLSPDKDETTVAMDYGQKRLKKGILHLYGTPGQARFEFMWKILTNEMDAFLLVIDSTDRASLMDAKQIIRLFRKRAKVPYMVVANDKKDPMRMMSPEEIARLLALPKDVPVLPCVASNKKSVLGVLEHLYNLLS